MGAASLLRAYFQLAGLWSAHPDSPFWPNFVTGGVITKAAFTASTTKVLMERLSLDAARYPGDSYRSGGATDLWDGGCLPRLTSSKVGGSRTASGCVSATMWRPVAFTRASGLVVKYLSSVAHLLHLRSALSFTPPPFTPPPFMGVFGALLLFGGGSIHIL